MEKQKCATEQFLNMPRRVNMEFARKCNLRCTSCNFWGRNPDAAGGIMDYGCAQKLMDELPLGTIISPCWHGETLLIPKLWEVFAGMKRRGFLVKVNTNGSMLTPDLATYLCSLPVDAVAFSLDATTSRTLKKTRGIGALDRIEAAVWRLVGERGSRLYPRIGVSFTIHETNRHEVDDFRRKWAGNVDFVRIGLGYRDGKFPDMKPPENRVPCPVLYNTMVIQHDGAVPICWYDSMVTQTMGNAFKDGVAGVWNGERFQAVRKAHEEARWDDLPFCKGCNGWADARYETERRGDLLIRRSPLYEWLNRIDRTENWRK